MKLITTVILLFLFHSVSVAQPLTPLYGRLFDAGGFKLLMNIEGVGKHTLIIEGGVGQWSLQWKDFQHKLSSSAKVITYDRAGYGWSEASPFPRTAGQEALELHEALRNAGASPPYILMGHSYGAFIMKAFLKLYPDEVVGLILAEGAHENQFNYLPSVVNDMLNYGMQEFRSLAIMGREGKLEPSAFSVDSLLREEYWSAYRQCKAKPAFYQAMHDEMYLLPVTFTQSHLPDVYNIPLLAITAEKSFDGFARAMPEFPLAECNTKWMDLQRESLSPFPLHRHVIIKSASHDLAASAPDELLKHVQQFILKLK